MTREPWNDFGTPTEPKPTAARTVFILMGLSAALIAAVLLIWSVQKARAHSAPTGWEYPTSCCWGPAAGRTGDCDEIPDESVVEGPNGFELSLAPGDHPKVRTPLSLAVPYGKERLSPDGKYHLCLAPDMSARCFFSGAHGS